MSLTRLKFKKGFTLVELLTVVIIIAILAAIAIPKFTNAGLRSKEASLRGVLKQIRNAIDLFKADTGGFTPNALADLTSSTPAAKVRNAVGQQVTFPSVAYRGPYLSQIDVDPIDGSSLNFSSDAGSNGAAPNVAANSGIATDGSNYSTW
ncbi:MAG TPA: prepilin-type N-terminal cleavage/methylation domain-containing protein [Fimbriimonadaceae bacterium]|jgi:prepilin-type N-terminal cleavage/methylation domain-containing protein